MSKLIPFALAGVGSAATSVGGVYLIRTTNDKASSSQSRTNSLTFESLDKFKDGHGGECVQELFGENINFGDTNISTLEFNNIDSFFGGTSADAPQNKSCLIINYKKLTTSDQWSGTFTWTWSFVSGDKGFVSFNVATTSTGANKELSVKGGVYLLAKEGEESSKTWSVKHKKEVTSTDKKVTSADQLENYLPKAGNIEGMEQSNRPHWDFMPKDTPWNSMCTSSCSADNPAFHNERWSWQGQSGGPKKPSEWSNKMDWFKNIYDDSAEKLKGKLNSFTGVWTKSSAVQSNQ